MNRFISFFKSNWLYLLISAIIIGIRSYTHDFFTPLINGNANVDDTYFVDLARHIVKGEWFGPYNYLTLIKVPGDVFWHALCHQFGISEFWARLYLYIIACILLTLSLKQFITNAWLQIFFFTLLIFNPATFDLDFFQISRDGIHLSTNLLLFTALFQSYFSRKKRIAPWLILLCFSFVWTYLIREEGKLLYPILAIFQVIYILRNRRKLKVHLVKTTFLILLPWTSLIGTINFISYKNYTQYGFYGVCERQSDEFNAFLGALNRVSFDKALPLISSFQEDREILYSKTKHFATLQPFLDGRQKWKRTIKLSSGEELFEYGGWLEWAIRWAVKDAGHYKNPTETEDFYKAMTFEINQLCDKGIIKTSLDETSSPVPPFKKEYLNDFIYEFYKGCWKVMTFKDAEPPLEIKHRGNKQQIDIFADFIHSRKRSVSFNDDDMIIICLSYSLTIYKYVMPFFFLMSTLLLFSKSLNIEIKYFVFIIFIYIGMRIAALAYIQTTQYFAIRVDYMYPLYPLYIMCTLLPLLIIFEKRLKPVSQ